MSPLQTQTLNPNETLKERLTVEANFVETAKICWFCIKEEICNVCELKSGCKP